jgi:hypothetical protein
VEEYFYYDGRESLGPHSLRELQEIHSLSLINAQTPVIRKGEKDWQTLGAYCDLSAPECQPLGLDRDVDALYIPISQVSAEIQLNQDDDQTDEPIDQTQMDTAKATEEQQESMREEEETVREQRTTQHQLLRQIRAELDSLWESQRESIISRIRCEPLDKSYESTRRKNREIYCKIEENAIDYWRRSGLITAWIRELTWREHDFTVRLRGKTESEKYNNLQSWLEESQVADLAGCYCFKKGREYFYIGQGTVLRDRIKQHEKKTYFTYSTSARIVIPKYKRRLNQLERLLILAHEPSDNGTLGIAGKTPLDDCLEFIRGEIMELVTDIGC